MSYKKKEISLPGSYLRLDVSHVIKIVSNWECLRCLPSKIRHFYLRCISHAYKMQSLEELCSLLTSLLVVTLSEDVSYSDENAVPAEICLQSANKCIKGIEIEELDTKQENLFEDFDSDGIPLSNQS